MAGKQIGPAPRAQAPKIQGVFEMKNNISYELRNRVVEEHLH